MEPMRFSSKLIKSSRVDEDTAILDFSAPSDFEFNAGQYVRFAFYKDGKRILRNYSIFSSPHEKGRISIYFKKVAGGFASNFLFNMKEGDEIEMKGPFGEFGVKDLSKDIFLISTGTGFAPLMSIIKDLTIKGFGKKIFLVRGYRKGESRISCEELDNLENENFKYYDILSRPDDESYKFNGHVQDFLRDIIPSEFKGDFYICGLKDMVSGVRSKLRTMGFSDDQIFFEKYD